MERWSSDVKKRISGWFEIRRNNDKSEETRRKERSGWLERG